MRRAFARPLFLAAFPVAFFVAPVADAQRGFTMTGRAWRDSLGVVAATFVGPLGFGFFLDPQGGAAGAVRLNAAKDSGQYIALGSGPDMFPTPWTARWSADSSLTWRGPGPSRTLRPVAIQGHEVSVARDSVKLAGFLAIPDGPGPHPAVLLINGSGPSPRGLLSSYAAWLAANGVAALAYDKRGAGSSTGKYTGDRFDELVGDASAFLQLLRDRPEIDKSRIGILGQSQGQWVAFIMAASDPGIRFIISTSGGAFPAEQELYRRTRLVADSGYSAAEVALARNYVQRLFRAYTTMGRDTAGLGALWQELRTKPWHALVGGPSYDPTDRAKWSPVLQAFAKDLARDWVAIYRGVHVPVLAINSADDPVVPAQLSHETLRRFYRTPGQLTTATISGNHGFSYPGPDGILRTDPRLFAGILEWITRETGVRR